MVATTSTITINFTNWILPTVHCIFPSTSLLLILWEYLVLKHILLLPTQNQKKHKPFARNWTCRVISFKNQQGLLFSVLDDFVTVVPFLYPKSALSPPFKSPSWMWLWSAVWMLVDSESAFQNEVPDVMTSSNPIWKIGARALRLANNEFEYSLLTGKPLDKLSARERDRSRLRTVKIPLRWLQNCHLLPMWQWGQRLFQLSCGWRDEQFDLSCNWIYFQSDGGEAGRKKKLQRLLLEHGQKKRTCIYTWVTIVVVIIVSHITPAATQSYRK